MVMSWLRDEWNRTLFVHTSSTGVTKSPGTARRASFHRGGGSDVIAEELTQTTTLAKV